MKKRVIALALCLVMLLTCLGMSGDMIDSLVSDPAETPAPVETTVPADAEPVETEPVQTEPAQTEPVTPDPEQSLYDRLMSCATAEEFETVSKSAGDEAIAALSEIELNALREHYSDMNVPVIPETVVFTDAGPFMPAVQVEQSAGARRLMKAAAKAVDDNSGLVTEKKAVIQTDGSYKISIEAYATGTVTTTTSVKPVDIVLVLDQSGSMAYDFNGNKLSSENSLQSRQYAMKQAVKSFIDEVNSKYNADDSDHRIAIVTFGSDASTLSGWTYVDATGASSLNGKIDTLSDSPSGSTNIDAGMSIAEKLMGSDYAYAGTNTSRQKVVIAFTDGVPTTSSDFETTVADKAIASAKKLKDAGATVYSVGIFYGAYPNQLYGDKWGYVTTEDVECNGNVGSYWGGSWLSNIFNRNDFKLIDIPAANRFLNYISNNFADANEIGITKGRYHPGFEYDILHGVFYGDGWRIDKNFERSNAGYYLTANDADSLKKIFTEISQNIGSTSVTLDSNAVVRDVVTPYFDMPAEGDLSVKTYDCTDKKDDKYIFAETGSELQGTVYNIDQATNTIDVSGFDFKSNYVRDKDTGDGNGLGKKLVIEFTVKPKAGFFGGNNVPTNDADSGIYPDKDSTEAVKNFDVPTVDVPIKEVKVTAVDKNVYCGNPELTPDDLSKDAKVKCGGIEWDEADAWQKEFVTLKKTANFGELNTTYTVTATVTPNDNGTATEKTGTDTAAIKIFYPKITFKDSEIELGQKPNYAEQNLCSPAEWKNVSEVDGEEKTTYSTDPGVTMTGAPPMLTYEYTPSAYAFRTDTYVNVEVFVGTEKKKLLDNEVSFTHCDCKYNDCKFDPNQGEFIVHIKTFDLTITKEITGNYGTQYGNRDFIFNVKCEKNKIDMNVVVTVDKDKGSGSVTIKGLPVGTYTITEDTSWSWRYKLESVTINGNQETANNNSVEYTPESGMKNNIVFTNQLENTKWLSFVDSVKNFYGMGNKV